MSEIPTSKPVESLQTALPIHDSAMAASVVAYQAYQETMRQFLAIQKQVISQLLNQRQWRAATPYPQVRTQAPLTCTESLPAQELLSPLGFFLITKDQRSVATYVSEALEQRGACTAILTASTLLDPDQLALVIPHLQQIYGPVTGIIHLATLATVPIHEPPPLKSLLQMLPLCLDVQQAVEKQSFCVLVASSLGGHFSSNSNFDSPRERNSSKLLKTLAAEWSGVQAKVVDFENNLAPASVAQHIVNELLLSDGNLEVGYYNGNRIVF